MPPQTGQLADAAFDSEVSQHPRFGPGGTTFARGYPDLPKVSWASAGKANLVSKLLGVPLVMNFIHV